MQVIWDSQLPKRHTGGQQRQLLTEKWSTVRIGDGNTKKNRIDLDKKRPQGYHFELSVRHPSLSSAPGSSDGLYGNSSVNPSLNPSLFLAISIASHWMRMANIVLFSLYSPLQS